MRGATLAFALLLTGCYHSKPSTLPSVLIPKECVTEDVILSDCDLKFSPPHCKTSMVGYKNGCEHVVVNPEPKENTQ